MLNKEQLEENIISLLGVGTLPDDKKLALLKKMTDLIQKRASVRIFEQLNDEDKQSFIDVTDKNDEVEIKKFLDSKNIDVLQYAKEETLKLKEELKDVVGGLKV